MKKKRKKKWKIKCGKIENVCFIVQRKKLKRKKKHKKHIRCTISNDTENI